MTKEEAKKKIYKEWVDSKLEIPEVEVIEYIVWLAHEYWERAGCESDFCVQAIGFGVVVFGGTNRVQWSVKHGFRIDKLYCSPNFLEKNKDY